ncbi:MAG: hypothetical protein JW885_09010 [Deltaproteobacteria bacterium]|nr:hypothetical protein [Candidatus Zymogenaceae bacterium]
MNQAIPHQGDPHWMYMHGGMSESIITARVRWTSTPPLHRRADHSGDPERT